MGDTQMKVHLGRLVDLEYVVAKGAGPATTYELAHPTTYSSTASQPGDRSGQESDRSGANADRSAIGRFRRHSDSPAFPQAEGQIGNDDGKSVGIGRGPVSYDESLFSQLDEPNEPPEADRSAWAQLRVVGEGVPVAHAGP